MDCMGSAALRLSAQTSGIYALCGAAIQLMSCEVLAGQAASTQGWDIQLSRLLWRGAPGKRIHCVVGGDVHEVSKQLVAMLVQDSLLITATSMSAPLMSPPAYTSCPCVP